LQKNIHIEPALLDGKGRANKQIGPKLVIRHPTKKERKEEREKKKRNRKKEEAKEKKKGES